jgi:multidrug resistance efflux pump
MTNNSIKKLLETQESLRRQPEPLQATVKAFNPDTGLRKLIEEANRYRELMRAALGPLEELRRSGGAGPANLMRGKRGVATRRSALSAVDL